MYFGAQQNDATFDIIQRHFVRRSDLKRFVFSVPAYFSIRRLLPRWSLLCRLVTFPVARRCRPPGLGARSIRRQTEQAARARRVSAKQEYFLCEILISYLYSVREILRISIESDQSFCSVCVVSMLSYPATRARSSSAAERIGGAAKRIREVRLT